MPQLRIEAGGQAPFVVPLRRGRTLLGRADRCDVLLPSDEVSRVHCAVQEDGEGWVLVDRSRHGTIVDGIRVQRGRLVDGTEFQVGPFRFRFLERSGSTLQRPTRSLARSSWEDLLDADATGVTAARVQVRVGEAVHLLRAARTTFGGAGADVTLGSDLPSDALVVRVSRGRPMVEPGSVPVFLASRRVRDVTPVLEGEQLELAGHVLVVEGVRDASQEEREQFGEMVGTSLTARRLFGTLHRMAGHDAPVLLTGESGTGKELAARGLHHEGPRGDGPFVALNCASIASGLVESELFGHERGAFTGAEQRRDGAFQRAAGGTLFLDEIGEMELDTQAKLLRALESGEVRRVGGDEATYPDVRVVAATHRDLIDRVREGAFRQDLYWRLAVLTVQLPALRERPADVPLLARTLLSRQHPDAVLTDEAERALVAHDWPGNVRELRNVLTRAYVMGGPTLGRSALEFHAWAFEGSGGAPKLPLRAPDDPERMRIVEALRLAGENRSHAARLLGMPRSTLLYKIRKHGLD